MKNAGLSAAIAHGGAADYLRGAAWLELWHHRLRLLDDLAVLGTILLLLLLVLLPLHPVLQDLQVVLPDQCVVAGEGIEGLRGSGQANADQHRRGQHCRCENHRWSKRRHPLIPA
ncbi:hypothetical protein ACFSQQ_26310 [Mesorhizobium kowhaii]|uniref:hypothetical protein n=1 Tax=Mesorhizobium kowhaii TaxID=1300272 RepID=UPI00362BC1DB